MTDFHYRKVSKFLSFVLRHKPEAIGLELDEQGWVIIDDLINNANRSHEVVALDRALVLAVVESSDKERFAISEDGLRIRANQGHSVQVDLQLKPVTPPKFLYHGTATRFLKSILQEGLKPQQRQHVHLSADIATATTVGKRYGKPAILRVRALFMHEQGFLFYRSAKGVWLVNDVPASLLHVNDPSSI